jgi:hypothetical protein
MANEKIKLEKLSRKGLNISLSIPDIKSWKEMTARDRYIPRSFSQTRNLIRQVYGIKGVRPKKPLRPEVYKPAIKRRAFKDRPLLAIRRGFVKRRFEECLEELYARLFFGLCNPYLTRLQRDILEADIDDATPTFENEHETDHFILRWTNSSSHAADNIADASIVEDTGGFLETAWDQYEDTFGRTPYVPADAEKMEVVFQDISGIGLASPPDGPIQFDSATWIAEPGVRQPTSAHELFHKLQYAFGYRTKHTPSGDYKWFSEGTASWSEVFVWQRVSGDYKMLGLFSNPDLNLYNASYRALIYWIFFDARQKDSATDNAIADLLQKYEALDAATAYPERVAYEEVIEEDWPENNVYGQVDNFFALFARDRRLGHWRIGPTGLVYPTILDPDGNDIVPALMVTEAELGAGDTYVSAGSVSGFGSDYYRLSFADDTDGMDLAISVDGASTGDFSYYLVWERNNNWQMATFPFHLPEDYGASYTLDLAWANNLVLIISGRGQGGAYSLTASVT